MTCHVEQLLHNCVLHLFAKEFSGKGCEEEGNHCYLVVRTREYDLDKEEVKEDYE
jgi:hypothetical protein